MSRLSENTRRYVDEVLSAEFPTSGTGMVDRAEAAFSELLGVKHSIAHVNGTTTLHAILWAISIGSGDEVIVPPLTMASTTFAVLHAGATPVYADVNPTSYVIDADSIREKITPRTKAIITVSLYGMPPDMDAIMNVAEEYGLKVIEDNAQAPLATYKGRNLGTIGHAASYSFQSSKHLTCGEGGMVVTNDDSIALRVRRFSSLGYKAVGAKSGKISKSEIQDSNYERHAIVGYNYRMSELNAAVLLAQIEIADQLVAKRRLIGDMYLSAILGSAKYTYQYTKRYSYTHAYWAFPVIATKGWAGIDQLRRRFAGNGGDDIYGAWKLTYQEPAIKRLGITGDCIHAERAQQNLLAFKTNYQNLEEAQKQADILSKTLKEVTWT